MHINGLLGLLNGRFVKGNIEKELSYGHVLHLKVSILRLIVSLRSRKNSDNDHTQTRTGTGDGGGGGRGDQCVSVKGYMKYPRVSE